MPTPIIIPRLGWSMEEGTFAGWQKQHGQSIRRGDVLFELEGEKAVQEIEAIDEGTLFIPPDGPKSGAVLKVGAVIGYLLAAGEQSPAASAVEEPSVPAAGPSVRRLARELQVSLSAVSGSGRGGRITEDDVRQAVASSAAVPVSPPVSPASAKAGTITEGPIATPRARKAAAVHGIDWKRLVGSGRGGRIRERDVLSAASAAVGSAPAAVGTPADSARWRPLEGRRAVIARRMQDSRSRTVPVTLTARVNAAALVNLRSQFRSAKIEPVPAYHDILAKLTAECLVEHPQLGARHDRGGLLLPDLQQLHLGLAVDTPEGLIVPVLRDVRRRSLRELAKHSADCIARARSGRLTAADVDGSVFTLSSLGSLGIESFTPVINYPETAILGIGAISAVPVVLDGDRVGVGQQLVLSLTFDHQTLDGAPAARFLQDLVRAVENPAAKLLSSVQEQSHQPAN
ncbi:MAG: dihydrolipoamide acetyltransferase family protein [Planctomycetaceae bacterium]